MSCLNFNQAILAGRLTDDPKLKTTQSGISVTQFTVAVSRPKPKESDTDFIACVAWRERADFVTKFFRKGSAIMIVGQIQTRSWTDDNGQKRYATEVLVNNARFVDSKADSAQNAQNQPQNAQNQPQTGGSTQQGNYTPEAYNLPKFEELNGDDDLPF